MSYIPLPEKLRPTNFKNYIGQEHLVGEQGIISRILASGANLPSLILWGPPGTGKTTLARIIATELNREFFEFSAVNTSMKVIEEIISDRSRIKPGMTSLFDAPIIFLDEIHRLNKAQQDKLLPHVEKGSIVLIGATTENPSFEVNRALLSRTRVLVLKQLEEKHLTDILNKALKIENKKADKKAKQFLIESSNGDARILLNVIEIALQLSSSSTLTLSEVEQAMQRKSIGFDKQGEEHYNVISAFIKSMRASQTDAAIYYLARMIEAGQDPLYIARRMVIFASEDIGMAQPTALVVANEVFKACEVIGYPECAINLAHGVIYLSSAKKDRRAYDAFRSAQADVQQYGNIPVPMNILNAPTKLMGELGYGKGYKMYDKKTYLPEKIKNKKYY